MADHDTTPEDQTEEDLRRCNAELQQRLRELTAELAGTTRKLQALEQFAYVAAHDLREPLRTLKSYPKLLARRYAEKVDLAGDEFLQRIVAGADHMAKLIDELSVYSAVSLAAWNLGLTDCGKVVAAACANLATAIQECGALISTDQLPIVLGSESHLILLFQHLLHNAVKFRAPDRPVQIHVSAQRQGTEWLFSIRDNGIGIEPQYLQRLFTKIGQEARLHSRSKYPGAGFGLAIAAKVVEGHHGRIWVTSQPGQGSTFCFTLPAPAEQP